MPRVRLPRSIKLANSKTIALVGSESLLGREIRDIVSTTVTGLDLRLIAADDESPGVLTRVGDEPAVVQGLDAVSLVDARAVFLAGSVEASRKALALSHAPGLAIIDLTYAAEDLPGARLRAPMVEEEDGTDGPEPAAAYVIAHPAAMTLAMFLRRLHTHDPIRRSVIQILAPASEHGAPGVEELQNQTISLLSFKSLPKKVFDAQLAFSLLAGYGEEAPMPLEEAELRIEKHLASLLALPGDGSGAPMPSLRLAQTPVFHGYSFSVWVEFESRPDIDALESTLLVHGIDLRGSDLEPPNNVGQAGQSGIAVGAITPDRNHSDAYWFWVTADNFRLAAENAITVARQLS
jgi:aspartate-semialdehyde dehydrogenase